MKFLDLTLPSPAENLALDEALLLAVDEADSVAASSPIAGHFSECEVLRVWGVQKPMIVIGRSSRVDQEVDLPLARELGIPVLRRFSGGAAVAIGSGCLVYSLLIHLDSARQLRMLDAAHRHVMTRMLAAIEPLVPSVSFEGTCDLVVDGKKFSGNSLRIGRSWMLYHGTILLEMDLSLIDQLLKHPPREPSYRRGRVHNEFVTNLPIEAHKLVRSLRQSWGAAESLEHPPLDRVGQLVEIRYGQDNWNLLR
jgi:lipoate---protein ligase